MSDAYQEIKLLLRVCSLKLKLNSKKLSKKKGWMKVLLKLISISILDGLKKDKYQKVGQIVLLKVNKTINASVE